MIFLSDAKVKGLHKGGSLKVLLMENGIGKSELNKEFKNPTLLNIYYNSHKNDAFQTITTSNSDFWTNFIRANLHYIMKRSKYSLEAYAILATSFVGLNKLNAQVTILDFDQDLRIVKWNSPFISHDTLRIDIDDNGIDDLVFDYESSGGYASIGVEIYDKVIAIGAEEDYELYDLNAYNVYAFNAGSIVDEFIGWKDDGQNIATAWRSWTSGTGYNVYSQGNFNGFNNYLPIKLNIEDSIHYGWVRLSIGDIDNEFYFDDWYGIDYSLVIYDLGYETLANTPIACQTNVPGENIDPILINSTDADDFSELVYKYSSAYLTDYSELRIYLIDNFSDATNFSVSDAMALDPSNYSTISGDTIIPYTYIYKYFDATTKTINGDNYDPDNYYTAYFMKIPLDGDTSHITLSTPCPIFKAIKQSCSLSLGSSVIKVDDTGTAADLTVIFSKDEDESDIGSYKIGLIEDPTEGFDLNNLLLDGYSTSVPKTGAPYYSVNLSDNIYTVTGESIDLNKYYYAVISATGDGYNRDLSCYLISEDTASTSISEPNNFPEIEIINFDNQVTINIDEINKLKNVTYNISSYLGQTILLNEITGNQTIVDLKSYPSGIYIISVLSDGKILSSKKIIII